MMAHALSDMLTWLGSPQTAAVLLVIAICLNAVIVAMLWGQAWLDDERQTLLGAQNDAIIRLAHRLAKLEAGQPRASGGRYAPDPASKAGKRRACHEALAASVALEREASAGGVG